MNKTALLAAQLIVRVSALRKPLRCDPPSTVLMLLAKLNIVLRVGIVVLQRDFHVQLAAIRQLAVAFEMDRLIVQRRSCRDSGA